MICKKRRWRHWLLGIPCVVAFLIPLRFPGDAELWERVLDFLHVPAFAAVALYIFHYLPVRWSRSGRLGMALALSSAASGMIEILQHWTGRSASFGDFLNSTAGAFLGVFAILMWHRGTLARAVLAVYAAWICAAVALPAWRHWKCIAWREQNFPLLSDFESIDEFRLWRSVRPYDTAWGASIVPSTEAVSHGNSSARVTIFPGETYPSVRIYLGDQDWRAYANLAFDLYNPGAPFELSMRVDDDVRAVRYTDRFYRALKLAPGWTHVRIPLVEMERQTTGHALNLAAMRRIVFFVERSTERHVYFLDWVRLE